MDSLNDEDLQNLSKENLQKILAFCESHGFSTLSADFPFSLDGLDNEDRFKSIFNELQHQAQARDELARLNQERLDTSLSEQETFENEAVAENQELPEPPQLSEPSEADNLYRNFFNFR